MEVRSYAKINLILEILGKRNDGYHELQSLMQTVSVYDTMRFQTKRDCCVECACDDPGVGSDKENLVYRAAKLFFEHSGIQRGIRIELQKRIPIGAGLGGGSSNAATVLKVLNMMFNEPLNRDRLLQLAEKLGSDVPFFIEGGTSIAAGRGERLTRLPFIGKLPLVLINPGFFVSTAKVYSNLNLLLTSNRRLPNILPVLSAGRISGSDLTGTVYNDLQETVLRLFPDIGRLLDWLTYQGAESACVSGSGGTVFGLFSDSVTASKVAKEAESLFHWACLAWTIEGTDWNRV